MFDSARLPKILATALLLLAASPASAEDGYRLWLRYDPVKAPLRKRYALRATELVSDAHGPMAKSAISELKRGLSNLLAKPIPSKTRVDRDGAVLIALATAPELRSLHLHSNGLSAEGYAIRSMHVNGHRATVIAANGERGLLYGAFALLRRMQTHRSIERLNLRDTPALPLRMLDHWDNLNGFVERGYAGKSLARDKVFRGALDDELQRMAEFL